MELCYGQEKVTLSLPEALQEGASDKSLSMSGPLIRSPCLSEKRARGDSKGLFFCTGTGRI